eukprot:TRINITY_DN296_c0_g4_i1.p1 TRINITY_DN296_c0_g4~~TRINITY_DN296_c0_g4_i1.p1  ORF type:complete len:427 (+),score=23.01 TRINITY_DN296_c0_g4_i1:184-1281(+)
MISNSKFVVLVVLLLLCNISAQGDETSCLCDDIPLLEGVFSCENTLEENLCDSDFIVKGGFCTCTCGRCNLTTSPKVTTDTAEKVKLGDLTPGGAECEASRQMCIEQCGGDIYSTVIDCNSSATQCVCDGQKLDGLFRSFGVDAQSYGKQTFDNTEVTASASSTSTSTSATATATASSSARLDTIRSTTNVQTIEDRCMLLVDEEILQSLIETVNMVRGDPAAYIDQYECDATQFLDQVSLPVRGDFVLNEKLNYASTNHSCWQAEFDNIDHTGKDGSSPGVRAGWQNYDWALVGETLAYNYPIDNLLEVVLAWYCSPTHRDILASCFMAEAGVGIAFNFQGEPYYTIMAACPKSDVTQCTCQEN